MILGVRGWRHFLLEGVKVKFLDFELKVSVRLLEILRHKVQFLPMNTTKLLVGLQLIHCHTQPSIVAPRIWIQLLLIGMIR